MKHHIGLLATARTKSSVPAPVTTFYQSTLFQKARLYAEKYYERTYFFSAKEGLLLPNDIIAPYDVSIRTFSHNQKIDWGNQIISSLQRYEQDPEKVIVHLHAGKIYRSVLIPALEIQGFSYDVPLQKLGIGQQLAWYNLYL